MAKTKKQIRQQELYYRENPSRIFDSLSDLIAAVNLFAHSPKLKQKLQENMGRLWNTESAATFLELVRHCMSLHDACGEDPLMIMRKLGSPIGNWASLSQGNATQLFRCIAESLPHKLPDPGGTLECHSAAFALWLAGQHNPQIAANNLPPAPPTTPMRLLYSASAAGSDEAYDVLELGWALMQVYHCSPQIWDASQRVHSAQCYWMGTDGSTEFVQRLNRRVGAGLLEAGIGELEQKAKSKVPQILALIENLWDDIVTNARCGIRAGNQDTYFLQGPWEKMGHAHRFFYQEGVEFPVVGMGIPLSYHGQPVWTQQTLTADLVNECKDKGLFCLLSYLGNLIAYHEIVCRKAKQSGDRTPTRHTSVVTPQIIRTSVREYDRSLPEGQRCSPERAEAYFRRYNREIADGMTYVSAHERGYAPGDRLIEGLSNLPRPHFSVNIEAIIDKM